MSGAKRLFDVSWTLVGLAVLWPAFVLLGLMVALSDGGPVFYRHERVGRRGRLFRMLKFRTMAVNADRMGGPLTVGRDPRITRVGYWIRKLKLDELPQLWNVLTGDMSLVGPRPEVPRYVSRYTPAQARVLELMPGITDRASIAYRNESELLASAHDPEQLYVAQIMPDKIRLNLEYAAQATVWTDFRTILVTLGHMILASRSASQPAASRAGARRTDSRPPKAGLRIVFVVTRSDSIGGAQVHVHDLAVALHALGHEAIVLSGHAGPFGEELARDRIPHYPLRHLVRPILPWRDAAALLEIRRYVKWLRPDLISAHSSKAGWLCRLVGAELGIPALFTAHGWSFTTGVPSLQARLYRCAERITANFADRIITVSEYDRQLAVRYRVVSPAKLVTVHNGMPDVAPALRARPDRSPARIVTIARLEPQKDHATLLRALAQLGDTAWELDIIGDGPLRPQTTALAAELGIGDRVRFLGARRDIAEQLAQHELFVLISHWEGFPRSILEAMRGGLPVVASDVGGVRESVVDGETGFVVPSEDVGAVRARLALLLNDPALRSRLGGAGRGRYERHFTFERMLEQTLAVYSAVVRRPLPGVRQEAIDAEPVRDAAGGRAPAREAVTTGTT